MDCFEDKIYVVLVLKHPMKNTRENVHRVLPHQRAPHRQISNSLSIVCDRTLPSTCSKHYIYTSTEEPFL